MFYIKFKVNENTEKDQALEKKLNDAENKLESLTKENDLLMEILKQPIIFGKNNNLVKPNDDYIRNCDNLKKETRIRNIKNNLLFNESEKNTLTEKNIKLGYYSKPGINFGRELFLGPQDGIFFMNQYNNKSYISDENKKYIVFQNESFL